MDHDTADAPADVRGGWTPARQRVFLHHLVQTGSVAAAARYAGMSRSSAHRLRRRLAGTGFDRDWRLALAAHANAMADPIHHPAARMRT
jgi:DNA-binding MurR/RpiR family transcriptional regulator